jgi:hypothetical protein
MTRAGASEPEAEPEERRADVIVLDKRRPLNGRS